jgi:uncharacterized protein YebE (UPF0316 family)
MSALYGVVSGERKSLDWFISDTEMQGLIIFGLRVVEMTLQTLRFMLMGRGYMLLTALFGFAGSILYLVAVSPVIQTMNSWTNLLGYAAGFATGGFIGQLLEERMAMGFTILRVISSRRGVELTERLREVRFAVTEVSAWGKDGCVSLLYCFVPRKRIDELVDLIHEIDADAFISARDVRQVQRGYWTV